MLIRFVALAIFPIVAKLWTVWWPANQMWF